MPLTKKTVQFEDGIIYEATLARLKKVGDSYLCRFRDGHWYTAKILPSSEYSSSTT